MKTVNERLWWRRERRSEVKRNKGHQRLPRLIVDLWVEGCARGSRRLTLALIKHQLLVTLHHHYHDSLLGIILAGARTNPRRHDCKFGADETGEPYAAPNSTAKVASLEGEIPSFLALQERLHRLSDRGRRGLICLNSEVMRSRRRKDGRREYLLRVEWSRGQREER